MVAMSTLERMVETLTLASPVRRPAVEVLPVEDARLRVDRRADRVHDDEGAHGDARLQDRARRADPALEAPDDGSGARADRRQR